MRDQSDARPSRGCSRAERLLSWTYLRPQSGYALCPRTTWLLLRAFWLASYRGTRSSAGPVWVVGEKIEVRSRVEGSE